MLTYWPQGFAKGAEPMKVFLIQAGAWGVCTAAPILAEAGLTVVGQRHFQTVPAGLDAASATVIDLRHQPARGLALLRRIRGRLGTGPGVAVLCRHGDKMALTAFDAGADVVLKAPVTTEVLAASLFSLGRLIGALPDHQAAWRCRTPPDGWPLSL